MFIFLESTFCSEIKGDVYIHDQEEKIFIDNIKKLYPELAHWGRAALYFAWGGYSRDIYAISWVYWIDKRELGFLAYCYICQVRPSFNFCGTGLYDSEVWDLGEEKPWEKKQPVILPDCFG
ncbi:hypothetical protein GKR75_07870 [Providencia sp. wls1919]|nr:hypothetical protein [Providencia sp. wls1919]